MTPPSQEMSCSEYELDYSALIDGELSPERAAEVRGHIGGCLRCAATLDALRGVDVALLALPAASVPEDLQARLRARVEAAEAASSTRLPSASAAGAAGAAPRRDAVQRVGAPGRRARRSRWLSAPAATAAGAAAAAIALYLALSPDDAPPVPGETSSPQLAREEGALEPEAPAPVPEPIRIVREETLPALPPALDAALPDEIALALDLETMEDLDVIANLELLEALVAMEEGTG